MTDVTELEKSINMRDLYNFLKRPVEEAEQVSLEPAKKTAKPTRDANPDINSFHTPASAFDASSSSLSTQDDLDMEHLDYTVAPPMRYAPDTGGSQETCDYEEYYGQPYEAI